MLQSRQLPMYKLLTIIITTGQQFKTCSLIFKIIFLKYNREVTLFWASLNICIFMAGGMISKASLKRLLRGEIGKNGWETLLKWRIKSRIFFVGPEVTRTDYSPCVPQRLAGSAGRSAPSQMALVVIFPLAFLGYPAIPQWAVFQQWPVKSTLFFPCKILFISL